MRGWTILAALLAGLWAWVGTAGPAQAHATLVSSEPAEGAVLAAPPARAVLTFNEPVSPLVLRLVAPAGASTTLDATADHEASLAITLPSELGTGTHVLSWRVISLDGHPVGGTVAFSIGAPSASAGPAPQSGIDPGVAAALWTLRIVLYAGLFVGVGGSLFLAWLAPGLPELSRTPSAIALMAGLLATPILVGLQGADALALPLSGLNSEATWRTGLGTSFGATAICAALAMLAGIIALRSGSSSVARGTSLVGVAGVGLALALSGHASAAAPQWLTRPMVFAHAVALTVWLGALVPLGAVLARAPQPEAILARFSRAIPWALGPLVVSGVVLAVVQVEQPRALLTTTYGVVLCAKLALVALLLALAAWNRFRLTPAIMDGLGPPRRLLVRSIAVEMVIVAAILGLVATWRFTPPPRALIAVSAAKPAHLHIHTAKAMADVTFDPGRAGLVRADIALMTGDFGALDAKEVRLTLENKAAGIEAISRAATKGDDAVWHVPQILVPAAGVWSVEVEILIDDFDQITLADQAEFAR